MYLDLPLSNDNVIDSTNIYDIGYRYIQFTEQVLCSTVDIRIDYNISCQSDETPATRYF